MEYLLNKKIIWKESSEPYMIFIGLIFIAIGIAGAIYRMDLAVFSAGFVLGIIPLMIGLPEPRIVTRKAIWWTHPDCKIEHETLDELRECKEY